MIRGEAGVAWDRLLLVGFWFAAVIAVGLFAWRGNWAAVLWGR